MSSLFPVRIYVTGDFWTPESARNEFQRCMNPDVPLVLATDRDSADYYLVINRPPRDDTFDYLNNKKTILARMEPDMHTDTRRWGEWADPDPSKLHYIIGPPDSLHFVQWHLDKTYSELFNTDYSTQKTKGNTLSVIVSDNQGTEYHVKRVKFVRYLQQHYADRIKVDVYGRGDLTKLGIKNHLGSFPPLCKDKGLVEYKYHFNCENNRIKNYVTEKFYDPIMVNTLVFYCGAPNVDDMYPQKDGYVNLDLDDFKKAAETIVQCIESNGYERHALAIKLLKKNILEVRSMSPRLYKLTGNVI